MDAYDRKIVRLLEQDARMSFADLAQEVGLSKTPCWKRVKALEESGVIRRYVTQVDAAKLGLGLEALVQVTIQSEDFEKFESEVVKHPLIRRCLATTGEADYILHIMAENMAELDSLLRRDISRLPGVRRTVTSMITREIKDASSVVDALVKAGL